MSTRTGTRSGHTRPPSSLVKTSVEDRGTEESEVRALIRTREEWPSRTDRTSL